MAFYSGKIADVIVDMGNYDVPESSKGEKLALPSRLGSASASGQNKGSHPDTSERRGLLLNSEESYNNFSPSIPSVGGGKPSDSPCPNMKDA